MGKVTVTCNELIVSEILGQSIDTIITVGNKLQYQEDNVFDEDRDIPDIGTVKALIGQTPTSSAPVLKFATMATFDGGDIELAGLVDDNGVPVPESGVKLVTKAAYVGDLDISQSLTYNPTTQVLSTGYENSGIYLLLTFEQTGTTPTFTRYGLSAPLSYGLT